MISLGVSGGPVREFRESSGYTDLIVSGLIQTARGTGARNATRTAALEACAGAWARAMAAAAVVPVGAATAGVDAVFLADVGRRLIRSGDALYMITVGPDGTILLPAAAWGRARRV